MASESQWLEQNYLQPIIIKQYYDQKFLNCCLLKGKSSEENDLKLKLVVNASVPLPKV